MYIFIIQNLKELLKRLSKLVDHSDSKIRKIALECLQGVFENVDDDYEIIKQHYFSNMRDFIDKEMRTIFKKSKKRANAIRLFERETSTVRPYLPPIETGKVADPNAHSSRPILRIGHKQQGVELSSVIPGKMFETIYIASNSEKKTILDDLLKRLESVNDTRLTSSGNQASNLIKVLHDCLEEANMLIVTLSMQITLRLTALIPGAFSEVISKHILMRVVGKYQPSVSKTTANDLILNLISATVKNDIISLPTVIDLMMDVIQGNKKTNSRECCLIWLTHRLAEVERPANDRMSLRDSIDWSYEGGESRNNRVNAEAVLVRLKDILNKETNSKIKNIIKSHVHKFEATNLGSIKKNQLQLAAVKPESQLKKQTIRNQDVCKETKKDNSPDLDEYEGVGKNDLKGEGDLADSHYYTHDFGAEENEQKSLLDYSAVG